MHIIRGLRLLRSWTRVLIRLPGLLVLPSRQKHTLTCNILKRSLNIFGELYFWKKKNNQDQNLRINYFNEWTLYENFFHISRIFVLSILVERSKNFGHVFNLLHVRACFCLEGRTNKPGKRVSTRVQLLRGRSPLMCNVKIFS